MKFLIPYIFALLLMGIPCLRDPKLTVGKDVPKHVAVIMDGNRRWAKSKNKSTLSGHKAGIDALVKNTRHASKIGIKELTVFAFSTENWARSKAEVQAIMSLFSTSLDKHFEELLKDGVQVRFLGRRDRLSHTLIKKMENLEEKTRENEKLILRVCMDYGSREEIVQAAKKMKLNDKSLNKYMYDPSMPDPDLIIRTGGHVRLSNFMLWQSAYAELYFSHKYWPDFNAYDFNSAIINYQHRVRTFGGDPVGK